MFVLFLNDMRFPNIEMTTCAARSKEKGELERLLESERVEPYTDEVEGVGGAAGRRWGKIFRKDGPLEWFNEPFPSFGQGVFEIDVETPFTPEELRELRSNVGRAIESGLENARRLSGDHILIARLLNTLGY